MKKLIILLVIGAFVAPLFAQSVSDENSSKMYYQTVSVERVYPTRRGYIVQYYRGGIRDFGIISIPNEWFTDAAGKAELVTLPPGRNWPTLTIFYKDGEFSHIRLYVHRNKKHQTWGNVPLPADVSRYFEDVDNPKINF
ncbi:MAG: hypothetical protein FWC03_01350 [Treponema sp.]|nr:hypothetical protein [Treponema sp.]